MSKQRCEDCIYEPNNGKCATCIDNGHTYSNYVASGKAVYEVALANELLLTDEQIERLVRAAHRKVAMYMYMEDAVERMTEGVEEELKRMAQENK